MKTFTTEELYNHNRDLFNQVNDAHKLVVPQIQDHVKKSMFNAPEGSIAEHASFIRVQDSENEFNYFLQLHTKFLKIFGIITGKLDTVIFHEDFKEYETARQQQILESVRKNGNENFPTWQNFDGKNVGKIF